MKKIILTISLLAAITINLIGQNDAGFNSVPVVNGKVVFEQFIVTNPNQTADQNYVQLQKWVKSKYNVSPLLSGIRFDDKANFVTVSSGTKLIMPANSAGVRDEMIMNYRFDVSVTGGGCMLVIRDITYQNAKKEGDSFFPKKLSAEQTITDQSINTPGPEGELRTNLRKASLDFFNGLYSELNSLF
ncbi:MAG: DUF4468 domain-containing protein [Fermentimonas sp.]|nr:DUF4468 domain-containing protein [Fermentimonas sp.]